MNNICIDGFFVCCSACKGRGYIRFRPGLQYSKIAPLDIACHKIQSLWHCRWGYIHIFSVKNEPLGADLAKANIPDILAFLLGKTFYNTIVDQSDITRNTQYCVLIYCSSKSGMDFIVCYSSRLTENP